MRVDILARTVVNANPMWEAYGYDVFGGQPISELDALAEGAGRICYESFGRRNPNTASNDGYLANILDHGHYSVLEHSSVSFLVRGVSRALLTELTRHRHLSFSVVSQRYVDYSSKEPVIPPALRGTMRESSFRADYANAIEAYEEYARFLIEDRGFKPKQAREAARGILPNAAPVDMVVTGNLRAWRDVLGKRHHVAADAEIREFAQRVLVHLREISPNSVQDIPLEPYGS